MREWEELGVRTLADFYRKGMLLPFEELRLEYELPQGDFILHGAITAIIRAHWREGMAEPRAYRGST